MVQREKEYAEGLEKKKISDKSENARDNILNFYNDHKEICDAAFEYYSEYDKNRAGYIKEPKHVGPEEFISNLNDKRILVLTANPIERSVLLKWMANQNGKPLDSFMVGSYVYNVYNDFECPIGKISFIHADPGKTGEDYTRRLLNKTCVIFQPDCIVAIGICYGFDRKNNSIGDVFLSDNVTIFRINYRDAEGKLVRIEAETEFEKQPSNEIIQLSLQNSMYIQVQNFLSSDEEPLYAKMRTGRFLSINSLMSNTSVKQALVEQYGNIKPKPAAGEMEGPGILRSDYVQEHGFSQWLIMKSICDWGEMKNDLSENEDDSNRIKDSLQAYAMVNSCSVFEKMMLGLCEVCYG